MRHRKRKRQLGRTGSERKAMLDNMAASILIHQRIETTVAKAKEARRVVEKLITLSKNPTVHSGVVSSKSGDKTIRVVLNYLTKHKKYGKMLKRSTVAHVHDETNQAGVGDTVEICKCRKLSKTKSWRLVKVLGSAG